MLPSSQMALCHVENASQQFVLEESDWEEGQRKEEEQSMTAATPSIIKKGFSMISTASRLRGALIMHIVFLLYQSLVVVTLPAK